MLKALDTSATGMAAQADNVNTISNNIANINTTAFKQSRTEFEDLLYQTVQESGSRSSSSTRYSVGVQIGSGVKVSGIRKNFSQGSTKITEGPFDMMINGDGFFGIILPNNEIRYTRDGSFTVDQQGNLVTRQGYKLFPGFTIPPNIRSVNVNEEGTLDVYFNNQPEPSNLGTIPVFTFINPAGLSSSGNNLYRMTESSGVPIQGIPGTENTGTLMQGALELSNVNTMTEMTDLIRAQRAYEMNSKVMGVADQMLHTVNQLR
ncbi:MAG: flagellar basal-body rod protein FlgG [Bdellovibrionales bacterium RIFOXYB1_FULL_37_110]|nr:MAG: flagellar basal-body rod protein FlgG [Bdellovibrionales bacterium RIFOXYA1_FULL_38_20]OFZ48074.1 MAG: flagellar basal-body rod protein FlgG [Bdellovibrionales bacterium RIFOXYC1_FULL_37_79]OFZ58083.1 MAG: flagellar basal-body rod protein FlgG [Bdellovibrionales bacterium RIFOXYB1_FULL_37_110]OFZ63369.1 MAG: flagellar basal-body rod protein FlgG [Bdellovibrionales bacterium RIFOXYD1_FULL_36_51]OFZ69933.1 MAG: flagellar basal-body rod protein FlgG [Bdellovibrionales bacterium RIFOXYC2_FU